MRRLVAVAVLVVVLTACTGTGARVATVTTAATRVTSTARVMPTTGSPESVKVLREKYVALEKAYQTTRDSLLLQGFSLPFTVNKAVGVLGTTLGLCIHFGTEVANLRVPARMRTDVRAYVSTSRAMCFDVFFSGKDRTAAQLAALSNDIFAQQQAETAFRRDLRLPPF